MKDPETEAREKWEEGTRLLVSGDLEGAVAAFSASLRVLPTAEGYTYRGWAYSFQGRYDDAIAECERALEVDPEFGNPYNDIGCYLMELGRGDEAATWFEKAKKARRYEPRHFPFLNLGRLHLSKGRLAEAIEEFQGALKLNPGDPMAQQFLEALRNRIN